jgi:hypothetical protein
MIHRPSTVRALMVALSVLTPAASAPAAPDSPRPGTGTGPPPPYAPLRQAEDYSYLKDPAKRADLFDPIKYIPLNSSGDWYLSLGGQARYRYDLFNNNNFNTGPQDEDGFHLGRFLGHADLHLGESLRGFVQVKSALEDGRVGGPRPIDADEIDIQQAFVDFKLPLPLGPSGSTVTFRAGRQELTYGAQRLIGPLDWANTRRTFEGAKAIVQFSKTHSLDLFWVRPVLVDKEEPNDGDGNASFAGVYDTLGLPSVFGADARSKLELYGLVLNRTNAAWPTEGAGDEDRYTVGARFSSNPKPFDLDVEADYQFGKFRSGDISAWAVAAEAGYTFAGTPFTPRPFIGLDTASGDRDRNDGDLQTFNQLFPTGHPHLGYIDVVGRQNVIDVRPGFELTPLENKPWAKKVTLRTEYHLFWRESTNDALYADSGAALRGTGAIGAAADASEIGSELDLLLNWQIDRHAAAYFGYSHFFPGDFISQTGADGDIDFVYAALTYTF